VTVNGPEGVLDWGAIDWRACEQDVRRLRQRIFKAAGAGLAEGQEPAEAAAAITG
jgi:hypothetical protein